MERPKPSSIIHERMSKKQLKEIYDKDKAMIQMYKLADTIKYLQTALQDIADACDPEIESHASFYFYAKQALEKSKFDLNNFTQSECIIHSFSMGKNGTCFKCGKNYKEI